MNSVTPLRPSLTTYTDMKLGQITRSVNDFTSVLAAQCTPTSRIYHAEQYRDVACKLRTAAAALDADAFELERSTNAQ